MNENEKPIDVFISYSSRNKVLADGLCARLEAGKVRCWVAPRDITPGLRWGECIIRALDRCRVMVLLLTEAANASPHVAKEVERAVHKGVVIIPVRLDAIQPDGNLEFFLSDTHWMDALTPPVEAHFDRVLEIVRSILANQTTARRPSPAPRVATQSREEFIKSFEELAADEWGAARKKKWFKKITRFFDEE